MVCARPWLRLREARAAQLLSWARQESKENEKEAGSGRKAVACLGREDVGWASEEELSQWRGEKAVGEVVVNLKNDGTIQAQGCRRSE